MRRVSSIETATLWYLTSNGAKREMTGYAGRRIVDDDEAVGACRGRDPEQE